MKITNNKEYLKAIMVRRDLKQDIKGIQNNFEPRDYPEQYFIAEYLINIFNVVITAYENGATSELTFT